MSVNLAFEGVGLYIVCIVVVFLIASVRVHKDKCFHHKARPSWWPFMAFSTTDLFLSPLQQLVRSLGRKTSIREKLSDQTLRILSKMHIGGKLLQIFLGLRIFVKVQYDIFKILSPKIFWTSTKILVEVHYFPKYFWKYWTSTKIFIEVQYFLQKF